MYRVPEQGERLGFGDVIAGSWLFDLYLRHDAVALSPQDRRGGRSWLANSAPKPEREPGKDAVLSHADAALGFGNPRQAIILTDDCEMETLQKRTSPGRILLAGIRTVPPAEMQAATERTTYRRFPLPPDPVIGYAGGIVELQRIFSVFFPSLTTDPPVHARLLSLDAEGQARLSQSLCAHVTRHGPLVASQESAKLAMLMSANGDPGIVSTFKERLSGRTPDANHMAIAEALTRGLTEAWVLEGLVLDQVSDAWERGDGPQASVDAVKDQLRRVRDSVDEALRGLEDGP